MSPADENSVTRLSDGEFWTSLETKLSKLLEEIDPLEFLIMGGDHGSEPEALKEGLTKGLEVCKSLANLTPSWVELEKRCKDRSERAQAAANRVVELGDSRVDLEAKVVKLQNQYDSWRERAESIQKQISSGEEKVQSLEASIATTTSKNAELETKTADVNNRQSKLTQDESNLLQRQDKVLGKEREVRTAGEAMEALRRELTIGRQQVDARERDISAAREDLEQAKRAIEARQTQLDAEQKSLDQRESTHQMTNSYLNNKNEELDVKSAKLLEASAAVISDRTRLEMLQTKVANDTNCLGRSVRTLWSLADIADVNEQAEPPKCPVELLRLANTLTSAVKEQVEQLRNTKHVQATEIDSLRDELEKASRQHAEHKSQLQTNIDSISASCKDQQLRIAQLQKEKEKALEECQKARSLQEETHRSTRSTIADLETAKTNLSKTEAAVASQKRQLEQLEVKENNAKRRATTLEHEKSKLLSTLDSQADIASTVLELQTQLLAAETRASEAEQDYWNVKAQLIETRKTQDEARAANCLAAKNLADTATKSAKALSEENDRLRSIDERGSSSDDKYRDQLERLKEKEERLKEREEALDHRLAKNGEVIAKARHIVRMEEERRRVAEGSNG